jgi:hypothetical protein
MLSSHLLSFHQHSGLSPISGLFFIHILASSPILHSRSRVFNNIVGYTFIFAIIFLLRDSLQYELTTGLVSSILFLGGQEHFYDSSLTCFIFINILGFIEAFRGLLSAVEGEPTNAHKKPRKPASQLRHPFSKA